MHAHWQLASGIKYPIRLIGPNLVEAFLRVDTTPVTFLIRTKEQQRQERAESLHHSEQVEQNQDTIPE